MVYVVLGPNPRHAQRGQACGQVDDAVRRDDQAAGDGGHPALFHVLSYVSSYRHHHLTARKGGRLEHAQTIANHESPKMTKLYDRAREEFSMDEVERIKI
jgi:hypothetical protein